ncbi:hypothetical protein SADUNF_Sadunf10G0012600 [Salix dunnii]|uniref:Uncharacterized protein n=1 Tax=Salix dunnii TaxID=1413687 RepID=A0A835MXM8_9ROSI|nr:hypothetical protein SADUNF_Sadunf10G0012600 [Salix dunnii]
MTTVSESSIGTYKKDLEEKTETVIIRDVALRTIQDLPTSFDSSAAYTKESLDYAGQSIDDNGSTGEEDAGWDEIEDIGSNDEIEDVGTAASACTGRVELHNEYLFVNYYFYFSQAEEARALLVKRSISDDEEEDLSWDFDDVEEEGNGVLFQAIHCRERVELHKYCGGRGLELGC